MKTAPAKDGIIKKGDTLNLGPYKGTFITVVIKSIHNNFKEDVNQLCAGEGGCFGIKIASNNNKIELKRTLIKKGMRIMKNIKFFYEFEAEVLILHHPTTIKNNPRIDCQLSVCLKKMYPKIAIVKTPKPLHVA